MSDNEKTTNRGSEPAQRLAPEATTELELRRAIATARNLLSMGLSSFGTRDHIVRAMRILAPFAND